MREIKFRAWDESSKVWSNDIFLSHEGKAFYIFDQSGELFDCGEEEPTIELYTGLKDKNGKEIYEGDIIKYGFYDEEEETRPMNFQVYWEKATCSFCANGRIVQGEREGQYPFEVIGNIHENPDLI